MSDKPVKKSRKPRPVPQPVQVYTDLRNRLLSLVPAEVGIEPSEETPHVWGVVMETGYPQAAVTLVSLADGTTSLYFGTGGGILGGGEHAAVAEVSRSFAALSERYFASMTPTHSFPLPYVGRVRFYVMTFGNAFTAEVDEQELGENRHYLAPLFFRGQDVITQLRLIQEQMQEEAR